MTDYDELVERFEELVEAVKRNDVALIECMDKKTNQKVPMLCLILRRPSAEDASALLTPAALLLTGASAVGRYDPLLPTADCACPECEKRRAEKPSN